MEMEKKKVYKSYKKLKSNISICVKITNSK